MVSRAVLRDAMRRVDDFRRRRGARAGVRLVVGHIRRRLWHSEAHVWYVLDLSSPPAVRELPQGYRLIRGNDEDADRIADLETVGPMTARARIADGADFWLVIDGEDRSAFACWTFHDKAPVFAAANGFLRLPADVAVLEDSVTSEHHRGRGIAPAAWTVVADELVRTGVRWLLTKVELDNTPSRRAVNKVGFLPYALMQLRRRTVRRTVAVWTDGSPLGEQLVRGLPGRRSASPPPEVLGYRTPPHAA